MNDASTQTIDLPSNEHPKFMRRKAVEQKTGLSRSSIYLQIKLGRFPKSIPLTESGKSVAWLSLEIESWMSERIDARDGT